jgi:hypothetical protein
MSVVLFRASPSAASLKSESRLGGIASGRGLGEGLDFVGEFWGVEDLGVGAVGEDVPFDFFEARDGEGEGDAAVFVPGFFGLGGVPVGFGGGVGAVFVEADEDAVVDGAADHAPGVAEVAGEGEVVGDGVGFGGELHVVEAGEFELADVVAAAVESDDVVGALAVPEGVGAEFEELGFGFFVGGVVGLVAAGEGAAGGEGEADFFVDVSGAVIAGVAGEVEMDFSVEGGEVVLELVAEVGADFLEGAAGGAGRPRTT